MLKGIFYAQFDNILGPKIVHQVPANLLTADVFDSISDYIITKPSLCGRLTCIKVQEMWIMGVPVCLSHTKYPRNALLFNLGFVLSSDDPLVSVYRASLEKCLLKLAAYMTTLERETEYLSKQTHLLLSIPLHAPPTSPHLDPTYPKPIKDKRELIDVMKEIMESLNRELSATVQVDVANAIFLKLVPTRPDLDPTLPQPYHVPVPIADLHGLFPSAGRKSIWNIETSEAHQDWDLALQKIIPYIDGVNYVKKIAKDADMDMDIVVKALQHLLYYQCIELVDVFQYGNSYCTLPAIRRLHTDRALQRACMMAIADDPMRPLPTPVIVFQLYCQLQPGIEMKEFMKAYNMKNFNVDIRRFVTFGLVNGLIRRLHKYPVSTKSGEDLTPLHNIQQYAYFYLSQIRSRGVGKVLMLLVLESLTESITMTRSPLLVVYLMEILIRILTSLYIGELTNESRSFNVHIIGSAL